MAVNHAEFGGVCDVAAEILGTTPEQIARLPNVGLAGSALAAPRGGGEYSAQRHLQRVSPCGG
ncbi:MAG TPA: hypothetical protein VID29_02740, partial [Solirubrobacteraceae bacterium]